MEEQQENPFTFFPSYLEAVKNQPEEVQKKVCLAIVKYGVWREEPDMSDPILSLIFPIIKPNIDMSIARHLGGAKGGKATKKTKQKKVACKGSLQSQLNKVASAATFESDKEKEKDMDIKKTSDLRPQFSKKKRDKSLSQKSKKSHEKNEREILVADATLSNSQASCDESVRENLFGEEVYNSKKPNYKLELGFYLKMFNMYFGKKYGYTKERLKKFEARRKTFSLKQLVLSAYIMANDDFFRGESENGRGWKATPQWHLENDTQVIRFLESDDEEVYRKKLDEKFDLRFQEYLAERKEKNA